MRVWIVAFYPSAVIAAATLLGLGAGYAARWVSDRRR